MGQEKPQKGEKPEAFNARQKSRSLGTTFSETVENLKKIRDALMNVTKKGMGQPGVRPARWDGDMPDGFTFKHLGMMFYVECGVAKSRDAEDLEGLITYGVSRPKCFERCPVGEETADQKKLTEEQQAASKKRRYECERNERCDHHEDKPLLTIIVSRYGVIKDVPGVKGSWAPDWGERVADLHYQVLSQIWEEALDWFNEGVTAL